MLLKLIKQKLVLSSHDVSSGGLITAISEMAIASGLGAKIYKPKNLANLFNYFFGEDQARYVIEINENNLSKTEKILKDNSIYFEKIGFTQKKVLEIEGELNIATNDLFKINNQWYKNL